MTMPHVLYNGPGNWPDADKLMTNYDYLEKIAFGNSPFKNRIINGDMRIDQRNAGAAVTVNTGASDIYCVDRWHGGGQSTDGVFTLQQSTLAPVGFTHSLKATITTADVSIGSTQTYNIRQNVEGNNIYDFGLGTVIGKYMTLSFWVRSGNAGNYGGALLNSAGTRSYPFNYTINSANVFEYKTITVPCDTTGTWLTDTGRGIQVVFSLGSGSSYLASSGAWYSSPYYGATGQTNLIATNGATFYITGVQLELGTVATPFELLPMPTHLMLCQRYFEKTYQIGNTPGTSTSNGLSYWKRAINSTEVDGDRFKVNKRASPTVTIYNSTGTVGRVNGSSNSATAGHIGDSSFGYVYVPAGGLTPNTAYGYHWVAEAEI